MSPQMEKFIPLLIRAMLYIKIHDTEKLDEMWPRFVAANKALTEQEENWWWNGGMKPYFAELSAIAESRYPETDVRVLARRIREEWNQTGTL